MKVENLLAKRLVSETRTVKEEEQDFAFPAPDEPMLDGPELSFGANLAEDNEGQEAETSEGEQKAEDVEMEAAKPKNEDLAAEKLVKREDLGEDLDVKVKEEKPNMKRQKVQVQETASAGWQVLALLVQLFAWLSPSNLAAFDTCPLLILNFLVSVCIPNMGGSCSWSWH